MKKIILILIVSCIFITGCGRVNKNDVVNGLKKKFDKSSGYKLNGYLTVNNNDEVYNYDVDVSYKKKDYYKVILKNTSNDHTQVILKNNSGVYVLTPSLNKSFKFQSDWPYDNSQIYLLNTIINDLEKDNNKEFKIKKDKYIFKTKVDYPNNSKLVNQKIYISKDLKFEKVLVYDNNGIEVMSIKFNKQKYSPKFNKDEFKIDSILSNEEVEETGSFEDVIYPLFVPSGTKLVNEEKLDKDNGKRVIMNYDGEKSFLLVEETASVNNSFTVIPTMGEPLLLQDTLGIATDNSLSWTSGGVDFYLVSEVMDKEELIEVAQSITGIVSTK